MCMAILLEKIVNFHGIPCFISKKQDVNAEGRFLLCKCSEYVLKQAVTAEPVLNIQHTELPELVWSG